MNIAILAAISGSSLVNVLVWIIAAGLVFYVANWFIAYIQLGPPFLIVAKVIIGAIVLVMLVNAILSLAGRPFITVF